MPNEYTAKIKAARDAGYSDDEIVSFIAKTDAKMAQAIGAGYLAADILGHLESSSGPMQFEKDRSGGAGFMGGVKTALGLDAVPTKEEARREALLGPLAIPLSAGRTVVNAVTGAPGRAMRAWEAGRGMPLAARVSETLASPLGPIVGVDPDAMREAAQRGDTGAVMGQAAVPAALAMSPLAAEGIWKGGRPVAAKAKTAIANTFRDESGHIRPVRELVLDKVVPKRAETIAQKEVRAVKERTADWIPRKMPKKTVAEQLAKKPAEIIRPGDPSARMVGNEGRPATWTNEAVLEEARKGNREAIQQVVRRKLPVPPNMRYVAGDPSYSSGVYNPRDVTIFTPEGTPIRQGGKKLTVVHEEPKVANKFAQSTIKISTDSLGVRWAEGPGGVRVSIPKSVPEAEVQQYAQNKLAEQVSMRKKMGVK